MSATDYSHLAAAIFTIVAILQLTRALLRDTRRSGQHTNTCLGELDRTCCGRIACVAWVQRSERLKF